MGTTDEMEQVIPPRIKAAFAMLHHTRMVTWQVREKVPMREFGLDLEKRVERTARARCRCISLGEMDFTVQPSGEAAEARGRYGEEFCI